MGKRLTEAVAIGFPDLRHATSSLLLKADANLADVSEILEHSAIAVTARI